MTIRDATEEDLPAIVEIYNESIPGGTATADLEAITVESRRERFGDSAKRTNDRSLSEIGRGKSPELLYETDDKLNRFYKRLDSTNTFNPGIGEMGKGLISDNEFERE